MALDLIKKASASHDHLAMNALGACLLEGRGTQSDIEQARVLFTTAADLGSDKAFINLSHMEMEGIGCPQDPQKAVEMLMNAEKLNSPKASCLLGDYYYYGERTIPQSYSNALCHYLKAAEVGDSDAQNQLGVIYQHGKGVPPDNVKSTFWYEKAAAQGNPKAQDNLGLVLLTETNSLENRARGVALLHLANTNGYPSAEAEFRQMSNSLPPEVILLGAIKYSEAINKFKHKESHPPQCGVEDKKPSSQ